MRAEGTVRPGVGGCALKEKVALESGPVPVRPVKVLWAGPQGAPPPGVPVERGLKTEVRRPRGQAADCGGWTFRGRLHQFRRSSWTVRSRRGLCWGNRRRAGFPSWGACSRDRRLCPKGMWPRTVGRARRPGSEAGPPAGPQDRGGHTPPLCALCVPFF